MKTTINIATYALAGCVLSAIGAQANIIANGNFEDPALSPDSYVFPLASLPGWNLTQTASLYLNNNVFLPAYDGSQALGFDGDGIPGATASQDVAAVNGQLYHLAYAVGASTAFTSTFTGSILLEVLDGTSVVASKTTIAVVPPGGPRVHTWVADSIDFVAPNSALTVRFTDTTSPTISGSSDVYLDAVSLDAVNSVPESGGTLAMLSMILGGVHFARRLRRA